MSAKLTVECKKCGYKFNLYSNNVNCERLQCPKCFTFMDESMVKRVYNILLDVKGLAIAFRKYASERNEPEFNLSFQTIDYLMDDADID